MIIPSEPIAAKDRDGLYYKEGKMSRPINFILNDRTVRTSLSPGSVVLDFLRREMRLTGTKEGCREGDCGACLVLLGEPDGDKISYRAVNSCLLPLGELAGKHLVTIEGLNEDGLNPVQQMFVDEGAVQCGFCTPGFIVTLAGFFLSGRDLTEEETVEAAAGNICRCTGYASIKRAAGRLAKDFAGKLKNGRGRLKSLVEQRLLPPYFRKIPGRLQALEAGHEPTADLRKSVLVAGGTDLFVQKPGELLARDLEFISGRKEFNGIRKSGNRCLIGAGTTLEDMRHSAVLQELFPGLPDFFKLIASSPIRQRATVGGNIVNASPIGDVTILLLALDASLSLINRNLTSPDPGVRREIALKDFFKGYKELDLGEEEILEQVSFPVPEGESFLNFEKVSRRRHLDIAGVNSAVQLRVQEGTILSAHLSAGGVAPVPLYLARAAGFLAGRALAPANIREAAYIADEEISPISDVRGTAEYRRLLLRQLIFAHFLTLFPAEVKFEELQLGEE